MDAISAGGAAKISHPRPASTDGNPSTSRRKARSASAAFEYRIACSPMIATLGSGHGNNGGRTRFFVACSNAYASSISFGSLHAVAVNVTL